MAVTREKGCPQPLRSRREGIVTGSDARRRYPARGRPATVTPHAAGPARQPQGASSDHRLAMVVIGLAVAARMARVPRSYETAIVVVIAVAAVAGLGRASPARSFARLAAWDNGGTRPNHARPTPRQSLAAE
jgi:hypothetical protein